MSSKARRIVNPYTGELLPEGYYMEEHRIVAPDGFAYPRNATTDQEDYWREADAAAARDMRELAKPYASREEMLADLHRDPPKGYRKGQAPTSRRYRRRAAGPGHQVHPCQAGRPARPGHRRVHPDRSRHSPRRHSLIPASTIFPPYPEPILP